MKFARLLATGKSLVNGNVAGRYQMRKGIALPQFISPKNPFKQEAAARPVAPSPVAAAPATEMMASGENAGASPTGPEVAVVRPAGARALVLRAGLAGSKAADWLAAVRRRFVVGAGGVKPLVWRVGAALKRAAVFCLDHNPFSAIGKPKLPGIPRFGKAAVQAELSLDRVQVVRNDLAHADLEVVRLSGGAK